MPAPADRPALGLAGGHAGGFVFKYVAERSGNSQVPHFHLTTDKDWFWRDRHVHFQIDDTGVLHWDRRTATEKSPVYDLGWPWPWGLSTRLSDDCLISNWQVLARLGFTEMFKGDCSFLRAERINESTYAHSSGGYIFTYVAVEDGEGKLNGFKLQARPERYPLTGIRSYYVNVPFPPMPQGGYKGWEHPGVTVHATSEDREATPNDPLAPGCEFSRTRCD